jgi:hypothetical protein
MGQLQIGHECFDATNESLLQMKEILEATFRSDIGQFLSFRNESSAHQVTVWVSPASEIVMRFDPAPPPVGVTVVVGFNPWTDEDDSFLNGPAASE